MFLQGETNSSVGPGAQENPSPGPGAPHPPRAAGPSPGQWTLCMGVGGSHPFSCPKSKPHPTMWEIRASSPSAQLHPAIPGYPSSGPLNPAPLPTRSETLGPPPSRRNSSDRQLPQVSQDLENHEARKNPGDQLSHFTIRKRAPVTRSQTGQTSTAGLGSQCSFLFDTDVPIVVPRKPKAGSEVGAAGDTPRVTLEPTGSAAGRGLPEARRSPRGGHG